MTDKLNAGAVLEQSSEALYAPAAAPPATERASRVLPASPALALALGTLALHLAFNPGYGPFGDELSLIVDGLRPAWGYVDHPPLAPLIAAASYKLFGMSLLALRLVPALAMTATVALTVELARELGGGRFAQWMSGAAVMLGGVFIVNGLLLLTDMSQPIAWLGCTWCLVRLGRTGDPRWWVAFGAIVGMSLTCKFLIAFYLVGLAVGVLFTPQRRSLAQPWFYVGVALALLGALPWSLWQATHDWPFLTLGASNVAHKNRVLSPIGFLGQQILFLGPAAAPLWIAGLWSWSTRPALPILRAVAIAYAVTAGLMFALHGRAQYLAPIYPALLAAGAVAIEQRLRGPLARGALAGLLVVCGVLLAPLELPILPPAQVVPYARALHLTPSAVATSTYKQGALPGYFAGMVGWREVGEKVAAAYNALPAEDRARAVFIGRNQIEAAAVELYGAKLHGPPALSGHMSYFIWGPRGHDGEVALTLGNDIPEIWNNYRRAQVVGRIDNPLAQPYETNVDIYVLREPRQHLDALWPSLKSFR